MKKLLLTMTAAMSALAIGCVEGEAYQSELAGEELDQTQQALGELGCKNVSMSGMAPADGISRSTLGVQQSPDWTYNSSNPNVNVSCPYQYLVEYTNLPAADSYNDLFIGTRLHGDTVFGDITNEMDCERTHLLTGYYVWDTSTSSPTTTTREQHGAWNSISNSCGYVGTGSGARPAVDGKYKVRVAVRARYCDLSDGCTEAQRTNLKVETFPYWEPIIN